MSLNEASKKYDIPRRTLRDYVHKNIESKMSVGRKAVLSKSQEEDLKKRIFRLCDMGFPLTPKGLRKAVFQFVEENNIANPFNTETRLAGRDWINGFIKHHPDISVRKIQNLNEARARKMNHMIVDDYFKTLKSVFVKLDIVHKPHLIFNMDEKDLQMCRHKSPNVLAKKGVRRVHSRGKEHGENVTCFAAGSAVGMAIPPMILFKCVRKDRQ